MSSASIYLSPASDIEAETERQKTALLYRNALSSVLVNAINASLLAYVNTTQGFSAHIAFNWCAIVIIISCGRFVLVRRFDAAQPDAIASIKWRKLFIAGATLTAVVWGTGTLLFMWHAPISVYLFTGLVVAGMVAGAVPLLGPVLVAYQVYALLILVPMAAVILLQADSALDWAFGSMTLFFLMLVLMGARTLHRTVDDSIRLRLAQGALVDGLEQARHEAEAALDEIRRKEVALKGSEERYRLILQHSPTGILHYDRDLNITYCNDRFAEILHTPREKLLGLDMKTLKDPRVLPALREVFDGETCTYEGEYVSTLTHARIWISMSCSPLLSPTGQNEGGVAIVEDITERMRSEEAVRLNEARFRYMLETSPIAVRIAGLSGRKVLFANQRYAELIDSPPDRVLGVDPVGYYANRQEYEEVLNLLSRGERVTDKLVELHIPGGTIKWALASYLPFEYEHESAVLGWFYDITERMNMEAALRVSELRLTTAQHLAQLGNWELDLVSNQLWWSDEVFRIFEIDPNRFAATYEAFAAAIHPEDRDSVAQAYSDSLANRTPYDIEHRLLFPEGRVKYVHERCETEFDQAGKPRLSSGTVQDITERKRAEMALRQNEAITRALINAIRESTILIDRSGTVFAINEVGARRLHTRPDDLIGKNIYTLLPPALARSRAVSINRVFETGQSDHLQDVREGIHFDISHYPVFDENGKVVKLAIYAADVTEQRQLQGIDRLFHGIDQHVLRGSPLEALFEYICSEVVKTFGLQYIWIGRKEAQGRVSIVASAGPASSYRGELERIGVRWDSTPQGKGPTGTAIKSGQTQVYKASDSGFSPWQEAARRHRLNAILAIPLIIRGEIYGAFTLYSEYETGFDAPDMQQYLSNIASRICVALEIARDQQQLTLLSKALATTANGVFITDQAGRIIWLNQAFTLLTGYAEQEALGMKPDLLNSDKQDAEFFKNLWRDISRGEVWRSEMVNRRKDGSEFFVRQTITPILAAEGGISHYIAIQEDISAEKAAEARIEHMAHYDALTNLPNRALFLDRLQQALATARRSSRLLALMFLDLDRFKEVNDTLGHHLGDLLLQQVAARLKACVRESDTVARLAGDEFTIILPEIATSEDARVVAEKIVDIFATPFDLDGHQARSSTSIGIALFAKEAMDGDELLKRADVAMYAAKQNGRNTFAFFRQGQGGVGGHS